MPHVQKRMQNWIADNCRRELQDYNEVGLLRTSTTNSASSAAHAPVSPNPYNIIRKGRTSTVSNMCRARFMVDCSIVRTLATRFCFGYFSATSVLSDSCCSDSLNGAFATPRSVMIAAMYFAGVTSNAGFST